MHDDDIALPTQTSGRTVRPTLASLIGYTGRCYVISLTLHSSPHLGRVCASGPIHASNNCRCHLSICGELMRLQQVCRSKQAIPFVCGSHNRLHGMCQLLDCTTVLVTNVDSGFRQVNR